MSNDYEHQALKVMIEAMQREGRSEREIVRMVERSHSVEESPGPRRSSLRKAVHVGRWRVEVARL